MVCVIGAKRDVVCVRDENSGFSTLSLPSNLNLLLWIAPHRQTEQRRQRRAVR